MNKSNLVSVISALMVAVVFLAACSKKVEYANVIPADASVVVSIDLNSLSQKSGIKDNDALKQKLTDALKSGLNADALQYMEKVLKDPSESGISITDKVYLFATDAAERQGLVARVTDVNKVKALFKLLEDEQIGMKLTDSGINGYQYTFLNEKDFACFNENTLLILIGKNVFETESTEEAGMKLISQTVEQSILPNEGFKQMSGKTGDIIAYMTMDVLPTEYAVMYASNLPEGVCLKDMAYTGVLNFEKGNVALELEGVKNEALAKYQQQYKGLLNKLGSGFMDYFPANSMLYVGINVAGDKLVDLMASNPECQKMLKNVEGSGIDLRKLISSVDGNLAYGITSVSAQGMPSLACYVQVKNDEILKVVNNSFGGAVKKIDENNYSVALGMGINAFYGMKDKVLYFTMDEETAKNICKEVDSPMSNAKWASTSKSSYGFMVLNIKDILSVPMVNMMMSMKGEEMAFMGKILSQFDYIEFVAPEMNKLDMNIVMTNQDENSLKQLITLGEQLAGNK